MERTPQPNEIYQHFKGNLYRVITLAKQADTGEILVIYQALYGDFEVFARPLSEFTGKVDREKYPGAAAEYRFTLLPQIVGQSPAAGSAQPFGQSPAAGSAQPFGQSPSAGSVQLFGQSRPSGQSLSREPQPPSGLSGTSDRPYPDDRSREPDRSRFREQPQGSGVTSDMGRTSGFETRMPAEEERAEEEEPALDPLLLAFLDAETYEEKLAIFTDMRSRVTDDMLTTMAVSLDIDLKEGELMDRYEELKNCIIMLEKYECTRLR